jgi:hypothetical protein
MDDRLRPNEVGLFGQRFHASVAITYVGLGFILADALTRWFAGGAAWVPLVGLLMLFAGAIWWVALWWRQRTAA